MFIWSRVWQKCKVKEHSIATPFLAFWSFPKRTGVLSNRRCSMYETCACPVFSAALAQITGSGSGAANPTLESLVCLRARKQEQVLTSGTQRRSPWCFLSTFFSSRLPPPPLQSHSTMKKQSLRNGTIFQTLMVFFFLFPNAYGCHRTFQDLKKEFLQLFVLSVAFPSNGGKMYVVINLLPGFRKVVKFKCFVIIGEREENLDNFK